MCQLKAERLVGVAGSQMTRRYKRGSQDAVMASAVTKRVMRSQTRRENQHAAMLKPTRTASIHATEQHTATATFVTTLVGHEELFLDRLVRFLPTGDLVSVCDAISCAQVGRSLLENAAQWQYMTNRDGFAGSVVVTPTTTCRAGCWALRDYLSRRSQLERFDTCVSVIAGDLGTIKHVNGVSVDCLAFPTSRSFRDPGMGVAGRVHRRIATDLARHIPPRNERPEIRDVLTTPGNNADIKRLVHCVGPSRFDRDRRIRLYNTYSTALCVIERAADVQCAAFASVSTGTLQYPKPEAAEIAMAAVRDLFRTHRWPANKKIAFVCLDKDVLKAFTRAQALTRRAFFTSSAAFPAHVQEIPAAP